jgi:hypothetical protein
MKKHLLIIGIIAILVIVEFSGCTSTNNEEQDWVDENFPIMDKQFFEEVNDTIQLLSQNTDGIIYNLNQRINSSDEYSKELYEDNLQDQFTEIRGKLPHYIVFAAWRVSPEYSELLSDFKSMLIDFDLAFGYLGWLSYRQYLQDGTNDLKEFRNSCSSLMEKNPFLNKMSIIDDIIQDLEEIYELEIIYKS